MFGIIGKETLKTLAERDFETSTPVKTPEEIFHTYLRYVEAWEHRLGKEATSVIEHQVKKEIESMSRITCSAYRNILNRNKSPNLPPK